MTTGVEDIENRKIFANNLDKMVKSSGLNRKEFAERIGIKYSTFLEWIHGNKMPRISTIDEVAFILGVTREELIWSDPNKSQDKELWELREAMRTNPSLKVLFDVAKGASEEDLKKATEIIKVMRGTD